jgi:hypothetical protein
LVAVSVWWHQVPQNRGANVTCVPCKRDAPQTWLPSTGPDTRPKYSGPQPRPTSAKPQPCGRCQAVARGGQTAASRRGTQERFGNGPRAPGASRFVSHASHGAHNTLILHRGLAASKQKVIAIANVDGVRPRHQVSKHVSNAICIMPEFGIWAPNQTAKIGVEGRVIQHAQKSASIGPFFRTVKRILLER